MQLKSTVNTLTTLPSTGHECHHCEDGTFVQDGYERICTNCQYTPTTETQLRESSSWQTHRDQVTERAYGDTDGRPKLVGGYEDAYWGEEGTYTFVPSEGQFIL